MNRANVSAKVRTVGILLLQENGHISPVDVLLRMGRLSKDNYERWRRRHVPYLEKVVAGSLNEHEFFLRELQSLARELDLKPSRTMYVSWGKGSRQPLRFTKTGNPRLENWFSTHYIGAQLRQRKHDATNNAANASSKARKEATGPSSCGALTPPPVQVLPARHGRIQPSLPPQTHATAHAAQDRSA